MVTPLEVFCCYAREDQEMLRHLKKHLAPLERQSQITIWSDTNLNAGAEWEKELHQHLESADIILLLISPDFMASDYCYSTEMGRAIARHNEGSAQVIPILLRATFWQNAPFAKLQLAPTNAKPVTNWPDRDDAFHDITTQIDQIVSELQIRQEFVKNLENFYFPIHRKLAFYDPLHDNDRGYKWDENIASDGSFCKFIKEAYYANQTNPSYIHHCLATETNFSDFTFEVQMTIIEGGGGGIIFRADSIAGKWYQVSIFRDGQYTMFRSEGYFLPPSVIMNGFSSAIKTGLHQTNLVAVLANKGDFDLYVNRQKIASAKDNTFSHGHIGVLATGAPSEVRYSNTKVWV